MPTVEAKSPGLLGAWAEALARMVQSGLVAAGSLTLTDAEVRRFLLQAGKKADGLSFLLPALGGLQGARRNYPLSYPLVIERIEENHGRPALDWLLTHDQRLLTFVLNSIELSRYLGQLVKATLDPDRPAARRHLLAVTRSRDFSYQRAVSAYKVAGDLGFALWESMFGGSPWVTAVEIDREADGEETAAAARARAFERNKGRGRIQHEQIAVIEETFPDTKLVRGDPIEPLDGATSKDEAIVFARLAGRTSAVQRVEGRWYVYALSAELAYKDIWKRVEDEDGDSVVLPVGPARPDIILSDGYVLRTKGDVYRGSALSTAPEGFFRADVGLAHRSAFALSDDRLRALFMLTCLDFILLSLRQALGRLAAGEAALDKPGAVEALQEASAAYRRHKLIETRLTVEAGKRDLTADELAVLFASMAMAGAITLENPTAVTMVENKLKPDASVPPEDSEVVDLLAGLSAPDAVEKARAELAERRKNVFDTRRRLYLEPGKVLTLQSVHEEVLARLPPDLVEQVKSNLAWHRVAELASALGMGTGILAGTLLIGALAVAAGPVTALFVFGGSAIWGGVETVNAFDEASAVAAMVELDQAGGFALATPGEARWAYTAACVSLAFTALDVGGWARSTRQLLRVRALVAMPDVASAVGTSKYALRDAAERIEMTERQLLRELETANPTRRAEILNLLRKVTRVRAGGARAGSKLTFTPADAARISQRIMQGHKAFEAFERVLYYVQRAGPDITRERLLEVRAYLFDSPGIGLMDYNVAWWDRIAAGQASVADMATLRHELAEIDGLKLIPNFDFLGVNRYGLSEALWQSEFARHQAAAHKKATAAEFEFLADQVVGALRGEVALTPPEVAALYPTGALPGHQTNAYLDMATDQAKRLGNDGRLREWLNGGSQIVTLTAAVRRRLGLTGPVTLSDLVRAVRNADMEAALIRARQITNSSIIPDARTAGATGILRMSRHMTPAGEETVEIWGRVLDALANPPQYNRRDVWRFLREKHGLLHYDAAHLWGPGFGDEAFAGIMLAPSGFNRIDQNTRYEDLIRVLGERARLAGGELRVRAVATSHPQHVADGVCLARVQYTLELRRRGTVYPVGSVDIQIGPPPEGKVTKELTGPWALP